jgi:EAL domain-containing protein (putative c-di-GMP-specific phosphodiesterase class I)/CHASE2 domain-containing sensor protein
MQQQANQSGNLLAAILRMIAKLRTGFKRHTSSAVQRRRSRVAGIAVLVGAIAGLIELPLPLEDAYRSARAVLRAHDARDDIVVVAIDDSTMNEFNWEAPTRSQDAAVLNRLFGLGASRVVFDRAFPSITEDDEAFAEALRSFKGKVWLGGTPQIDTGLQQHDGLLPTPELREEALLASMEGQKAPFGLAIRFPTSSRIAGKDVPSISALLASYRGEKMWYRPDWALRPGTIPTLSYAEVFFERVPASAVSGKQMVIAQTHAKSQDLHRLPLGDQIPGVYFHVMGAHTLKDGAPLDLGWYPALLAALAIILVQARKVHPSRSLTWTAVAALALAPLILDRVGIIIEIFPALIALILAVRGLNKVAVRKYEDATSLVRLEAATRGGTAPQSDVYALKLLNVLDHSESEASTSALKFMERVARFLAQADPTIAIDTEFAVQMHTLVWCAPALSESEIEEHCRGILALVRNALNQDRHGTKLRATLGVDVNYHTVIKTRISNAILASENCTPESGFFCISDKDHVRKVARRRQLCTELEMAIENKQIDLGYQPKVNLRTGKIVGVEALLRWHHPQFGQIAAQEAVRIAEDYDLIDDLTFYVVDRAMHDLRNLLRTYPDFKVAINFCPKTLLRADLVEGVALILSKYDVKARSLIIEITESTILDVGRTRATISDFITIGSQISVDDFGTGYSNLDYIRQIPSAELKIDRRFVANLGTSANGDELVRGTIELAHSVSKDVVAEGVERKETADRLRALGCDMAQGYFFSRAISARALAKLLRDAQMAA